MQEINLNEALQAMFACNANESSKVNDIDEEIEAIEQGIDDYKIILEDNNAGWINKAIQSLRIEKRNLLKGENN